MNSPLNVPCWLALEAMRREAAEQLAAGEARLATSTEITDAYVEQFSLEITRMIDRHDALLLDLLVTRKPKKPMKFEEWQQYVAGLIEEGRKQHK